MVVAPVACKDDQHDVIDRIVGFFESSFSPLCTQELQNCYCMGAAGKEEDAVEDAMMHRRHSADEVTLGFRRPPVKRGILRQIQ